ncbi:MAG TPA: helix-turn-helix domain-containing protein [Solirubrobacterales bacterium]
MAPRADALAKTMRAELPAVIDEVIAEIGREVPEYARPLEGNFGRNVRVGVREALGRFVERVADPEGAAAHDPSVYVGLGRGEFREGRTLHALLQAYRVGARVAWRRLSAAALAAGADGRRIAALAESVFAYIDELSAESAEGFALEQAARAGERQRLRERLLALLLADPPAEPATVAQAAEEAGWALPERVAAIAIAEGGEEPAVVARRVGPTAIGASVEGRALIVLADPEGPGARAALARALGDAGGAVGPTVAPAQARRSFERAAAALEVVGAEDGGLVIAEEHLAELLLDRDRQLASELAGRALAPFEGMPEGRRARLVETLAAWLDNDRQPTPTAAALHLHPQTVRYRVRQLRELFGDALDDPRRRFELTLALRVRKDGAA